MTYHFDEKAAQAAVAFFERGLRHTIGHHAGTPFDLMPFQRQMIRDVWGWKRPDGTRRYRQVFLALPRKNGKSTLCSGLALLLLMGDGEMGAEVYSAAADRGQAGIVFTAAGQMIKASPLGQLVQVYKNSIAMPGTGSTYKVLSADAHTKHGLNAHGIIFDEVHAQPDRELWDVLTTSTGARRQPLTVAITTAGYDRESICYELWTYARQVRDGLVQDDTLLPMLYETSAEEDWQDPAVWAKCNPGLGQTISLDYLEQEVRKAKSMPALQNTFKRLHLNSWTNQATRFIDMELWESQAGVVDESQLEGLHCWGGLDLSSVSDTTAWVMIFAHPDVRDKVYVLPRIWVPSDRIHDTRNKYADQYRVWAAQGYLRTVPGDAIDYSVIKAQVIEDCKRFKIISANADRLFQGSQLIMELQAESVPILPMGQGFFSMAAPMKEFERLLRLKGIQHGGHPVLRWMADNVAVKQDPSGNLKPDKATSQGRIDGIVSLIMALDRWMRGDGPKTSIYASRGLRTL
jgi:phage terminase large subunit-like protein